MSSFDYRIQPERKRIKWGKGKWRFGVNLQVWMALMGMVLNFTWQLCEFFFDFIFPFRFWYISYKQASLRLANIYFQDFSFSNFVRVQLQNKNYLGDLELHIWQFRKRIQFQWSGVLIVQKSIFSKLQNSGKRPILNELKLIDLVNIKNSFIQFLFYLSNSLLSSIPCSKRNECISSIWARHWIHHEAKVPYFTTFFK